MVKRLTDKDLEEIKKIWRKSGRPFSHAQDVWWSKDVYMEGIDDDDGVIEWDTSEPPPKPDEIYEPDDG